jgi:DNA-binding CsgD family transcriptional regulator
VTVRSDDLPSFLKKNVLLKSFSDIEFICAPLKKLGICGFIYMRHFPDGTFIDLSNQIDWTLFFISKYYAGAYVEDDIQDHMFLSDKISLWVCNEHNKVWHDGIKHFGFGNGITITVKNKSYDELFCFYANKNNQSINEFYISNLDVLKKFCGYFREKTSGLIEEGYKSKLITPVAYKNFNKNSVEVMRTNVQSFLNEIDSEYAKQYSLAINAKLSCREISCIESMSQGLSAKETAKKLCISPRTVQTHIENARLKFNCNNLVKLVHVVTQLKDQIIF